MVPLEAGQDTAVKVAADDVLDETTVPEDKEELLRLLELEELLEMSFAPKTLALVLDASRVLFM